MAKPNSSDDLLMALLALAVQFGIVFGFSWLGWWAVQPIFPALDYSRFGVGAGFLFLFLQGIFKPAQ